MSGAVPYRLTPAGLTLRIRVTPNAGADRIEGVEIRADGEAMLKLRVAAVADRGAANAAAIALLAKALGVPKSMIGLAAGDTARIKTLRIQGDSAALASRLARLGEPPAA